MLIRRPTTRQPRRPMRSSWASKCSFLPVRSVWQFTTPKRPPLQPSRRRCRLVLLQASYRPHFRRRLRPSYQAVLQALRPVHSPVLPRAHFPALCPVCCRAIIPVQYQAFPRVEIRVLLRLLSPHFYRARFLPLQLPLSETLSHHHL